MLLQELVVIAPIFFYAAVFDVDDYFANAVEKFPVVGDEQESALVGVEIFGEPIYLFEVEEVGRLVEQHDVRLVEQELGEHDFGALSAAQFADERVVAERAYAQPARDFLYARFERIKVRLVQLLLHGGGAVDELFQLVLAHVRLGHARISRVQAGGEIEKAFETAFEIVHHRERAVYVRVLIEISHLDPRKPAHFARVLNERTGEYFHERGLARAVQADDADMLAVVHGEIRFVEQDLVVVSVAEPFYRQNTHSKVILA